MKDSQPIISDKDAEPITEAELQLLRSLDFDDLVHGILARALPQHFNIAEEFEKTGSVLEPTILLTALTMHVSSIIAHIKTGLSPQVLNHWMKNPCSRVYQIRTICAIVTLPRFDQLPGVEHLAFTQTQMREAWLTESEKATGVRRDIAEFAQELDTAIAEEESKVLALAVHYRAQGKPFARVANQAEANAFTACVAIAGLKPRIGEVLIGPPPVSSPVVFHSTQRIAA